MSIAASALSCALEVREAQVAPEPAAEHDDAAASRIDGLCAQKTSERERVSFIDLFPETSSYM